MQLVLADNKRSLGLGYLLHQAVSLALSIFFPFPAKINNTHTHTQVSDEDKKTVLEAVKEALEWVEENPEADADEFNDKRKEVRTRV